MCSEKGMALMETDQVPSSFKLFFDLQSNLYITVNLGKWPGDRFIQGDRYIQVSFKVNWKLINNVLCMSKYSNHSIHSPQMSVTHF